MKTAIKKLKDFKPIERKSNGNVTIMMEYKPISKDMGKCLIHTFTNNPSMDEIKTFIIEYINSQTDAKILSGLTYQGKMVWLSSENQQNYKSAYDLAIQTNGQILPVTIKVGDTTDYSYITFNTIDELSDFYITGYRHIQSCLEEGWKKKDSIDWSLYDSAAGKPTTLDVG